MQQLREKLSSIELIDQSAAYKLTENQTMYLDAFGKQESVEYFAKQWMALKEAETQVFQLSQLKQSAQLETLEKDLALIEEIDWQPGEEELSPVGMPAVRRETDERGEPCRLGTIMGRSNSMR